MKCARCGNEIPEGYEIFLTETANVGNADMRISIDATLCPFCADTVYFMIADMHGKAPYDKSVFPRAEDA